MHLKPSILIIFLLVTIVPQVRGQDQTRASTIAASSTGPQKYSQEGISLEFSLTPLSGGATNEFLEGTEATVHFKILDANAGKALSNLRPTAWIDRRDPGKLTDARACREKVQSFLQAGFDRRPTMDLNTYFILALNHEHHQRHRPDLAGQPMAEFPATCHAGQLARPGGGVAHVSDAVPGLRFAWPATGLAHTSALPAGTARCDRSAHGLRAPRRDGSPSVAGVP